MPAWPKSFILFGANLRTAHAAMRLRGHGRGVGAQRHAFESLTRQLATTSYWRTAGVQGGMSYDEYRARVAPRGYEALAPSIEKMRRGEAGVLWPGKCAAFATTAGTSGASKVIPVTPAMQEHFRTACRDALLYYTARAGNAGVLGGRHLFLTGSMAAVPATEANTDAVAGEWPAIIAANLPRWAATRLYEPAGEVAALVDWQEKVEATIVRTAALDVSLIAGLPVWTLGFIETLKANRADAGKPVENLQELWPNLECYIHSGTPIAPYHAELRALLGPKVSFHEVYAGAEGVFAAQDSLSAGEMRLMTDRGLFFEFLPLVDFDEKRLEVIGDKAVPLAVVKPGVDYVVLVTTPAGLARYVVGDVVRFTSTEPPRLMYVGRTRLQLTAFGEHVIEKDVTDALVAVCQRHRWPIVHFHVAPLFSTHLTGQTRGRHEWWVELKPGTMETPTGPQMAVELDAELQRLNRDYASRRAGGKIESPTVRLVMPGVFRHWMKFQGKWGGQNKVARCRSDRIIADELAQITRFARD